MKKNIIRKSILALALVIIMSLPTVAYAASYSTTFNFLVSVQGATRSYSAGKITVSLYSRERLNGSTSGIKTFSVALYKKGFISSTKIGSFTANRKGASIGSWTNMDKGNYFFYLSKANDGARVYGEFNITQ